MGLKSRLRLLVPDDVWKRLQRFRQEFDSRYLSCRIHFVYAMDLTRPHPSEPLPAIRFRPARRADLETLTAHEHDFDDEARAMAASRLSAGEPIMLGLREEKVVFSSWLAFGEFDLDAGRRLPASRFTVYSYKVFTSPDARGLGICTAFYDRLPALLGDREIREAVCHIRRGNRASIRAHTKAGFQRIGWFVRLSIAGRRAFFVPPSLRRRLRQPLNLKLTPTEAR